MNTTTVELVIVASYDGEPQLSLGDVTELADILQHQQYGDVSIEIVQLQALAADGKLAAATYTITGAHDFDEDSWAYPQVEVTLPNGEVEFAYYRIDGRA
jgi:hypothetical protein